MSMKGSVLVVDENVAALDLVVLLLTRAGYEVAQATSGEEALRLAKQFKPDLILLDVILPDLSGVDLLRQIKADAQLRASSVVLLSSRAVSEAHQSAGLDAGAEGYIVGPVSNHDLLTRVRLFLRQHELTLDLLASEARFRDLIMHQADAVLVLDESGFIQFANVAAETLFGRAASTLTGSPFGFSFADAECQEIEIHRPGTSSIVAEMRVVPTAWEGKPAWVASLRDNTERRQVEDQGRLLHILESSLNEIYVFDTESLRFEYVNQQVLRNLGYPLEAIQGMTPLDLKPEFTEASFRQIFAPLIRHEQAQLSFETTHRRADGSLYPVEVHFQLVDHKNKRVCLGIVLDITERKQAERELGQSEDRFRLLWETCTTAIVLADQNSIIRYANPALLQVFGQEPTAAIGKALALLQPHHLVAGHLRGMQRHLETGQKSLDWRSVETIGLHKDGHEFPVEIVFSSMEINGELIFAAFINDITKRKQAQLALKQSEDTLQFVMASARVGYWDLDVTTNVTQRSLRHDQCFGYDEPQPYWGYETFLAHVHPDDRKRVDECFKAAAAGDGDYNVEFRVVWPDGSTHWLQSIGRFTFDSAGHATRVSGVEIEITDRKQAEEAVQLSQRQWRALAESMPQQVWITRPDGWSIYFNQRWVDYTGQTLDESYGDGWLKAIHPDDRVHAMQSRQTAIAQSAEYNIEFRLRRADGSYRWMLMRGVPFHDQTGRIEKWLGTCTDIDDLKCAMHQIAESASLLRIAGRVAQIGGWAISLPEQKLSVSEEVLEILEYPVGAELSLDALFKSASHEHREQVFSDCLVHGTPFDLELQLITGKGHKIWVRLVGQAVRDTDEKIVSVQGGVQDISRLKAADDQLRLLEMAVSRLNDIVVITEAEPFHEPGPRIVFVNEAFERRTGYTREEVLGKSPKMLQGPKTQRAELDRIGRALERWEPVRAEVLNYTKSGEEFWLELDIVPLADETGWYTHWVAIERDITERRTLEEQLRQSQRMEAVGQLTGGVAHDFNNLLTIILGNAELLGELAGTDTRQRMLAEMILGAGQRGAQLTQRLLAFARQQPLDPEVLDINVLLSEMEPLLRSTLGEHIQFKLIRAVGLCKTLVDPSQLENALLNLSINARDAMPDGGMLTIETSNISLDEAYADKHLNVQPGEYVLLVISDTGIGIAPENIQRVFEPFFTTKEKDKGTGLGLAMVYGFIKQSNGHINIYSEPGHGTTVKLYLHQLQESESMQIRGKSEPDAEGGSETILLVEDDPMVRQFVLGQLVALGYTVIEAENAKQALDLIRQGADMDLLFTDVVMPGMSGRQLADEAVKVRPELKVLYTSGYTENAIVHHGRLDPGVLLLSKPYRQAELASKLREALGAKT